MHASLASTSSQLPIASDPVRFAMAAILLILLIAILVEHHHSTPNQPLADHTERRSTDRHAP